MSKQSRQSMYNKFSFKDAFVIALSLITLAALIFVVRSSDEKTRIQHQQLTQTFGNTETGNQVLLTQSLTDLTVNEVNHAGWIELYNRGKDTRIDLSSCFITVNGEKKYTFPISTVMEVGQLLCVEGLGELGTTGHDIIGIYAENGESLRNLLIPRLKVNESYGCETEGGISYCYLTSSKDKLNNESTLIKKDSLSFSVPGGFYEDSFQLEVTAGEGMMIYYTLDGTEPSIDSTLYEEPILIENKSGSNMKYAIADGIEYLYSYKPTSISMGMVVRAIAVDGTGRISEMKNQTYFVGLNKASDLKNIPVVSITTSPENLFDYFTGIYVPGSSYEDALARGEVAVAFANYLNDWKKDAYVEYYEPQKDKTYEGEMSVSILKDISVAQPQKSLLLTANSGANPGSTLANYYNDGSNQLIIQTNRRDNIYKIREFLAGKLLASTTVGIPDLTPCVVFINGEYWGGYMLKAAYDKEYIERHYSVDKADVLIAKDRKIIQDSSYQKEVDELFSFILSHDLKEEDHYTWVKEHMDVQNYLEYFCANMYLANAEYGQDQLVMWKTKNNKGSGYQDGKWRFLLPSLDNTMDNRVSGKVATSSINTFLQTGVNGDVLFQSLLRSDEFKSQLYTTMKEMTENVFTSDKVDIFTSEVSTQLKKMAEISYKRFTGNLGENYMKEVEKIQSFFEQRGEYILLYTEEVLRWGGSSNVEDAISE